MNHGDIFFKKPVNFADFFKKLNKEGIKLPGWFSGSQISVTNVVITKDLALIFFLLHLDMVLVQAGVNPEA